MKNRYNINFFVSSEKTTKNSQGEYILTKSDIEFNSSGMFLCYTDDWSLKQAHTIDLKINNIINTDLQDKSIYRYSKLNLPRQKVDLLKEKFGLKIKRDKTQADYHVVSMKFLESVFQFMWGSHYTYEEVFHTFKFWKEEGLLGETGLEKCREILAAADKEGMYTFNEPDRYRYISDQGLSKFKDRLDECKAKFKSNISNKKSRGIVVPSNMIQTYNDIFQCGKCIYDTQLLDIIDEDLAVIDNDQYDQIKQMITSEDRHNRNLAVEMLANCNINKSYDVITGIYWWYYDWFKDSAHWNSVNVKAMRQQLKKYEGGHSKDNIYSYNSYLKNLTEDRKLSNFAVNKTRKNMHDHLLKNFVGSGNNIFKVDLENLKLTDEYANQILDE